jgi:hypothetical protein
MLPGIVPNNMLTIVFALSRVTIRTAAVQPEPVHG